MSDQCCCGGRCGGEPIELTRREFLERMAAGAAALTLTSRWTGADAGEMAAPSLPKAGAKQYPATPARTYRGKNLEAVAMPIGGIGTGSIWLDGQGRLAVWQIFNNLSEPRIPDSFFGVRVRSGSGKPVTRVLQTVGEASLAPVQSLSYEGGYPIARLAFDDAELPVAVTMEAFNPMIPLDAANSSIPCAIFRLSARNTGKEPAEVALFGTLQNAVGSQGAGDIKGVRHPSYGGNRNREVREKSFTAVAMDQSPGPVASGPVKVRDASGAEVPGPELIWLSGVSDLTGPVAEAMARVASEGGVVLLEGVQPAFFTTLATLRQRQKDGRQPAVVFEDFERRNYEGWKITGEALGKAPSRGTEPGQQPVSGFAGRGLVNTFIAGDGPQGTATSKPFVIEKRYIGFLIGGGSHAGQTCINLRIGDQIVRTATGKNLEALEPMSWDVSEFQGKQAVIEIVDKHSGGWGHINIDQIVFSDAPPEPFLKQGTAADTVAKAMNLPFTRAEAVTLPADRPLVLQRDASRVGYPGAIPGSAASEENKLGPWKVQGYTRLTGFDQGEKGFFAAAKREGGLSEGTAIVIEGPLGKGRVILALAAGLPWEWGSEMLASARGPLKRGERLVPGNPGWGTMTLAALDPAAVSLTKWVNAEQLARFIARVAGEKSEEVGGKSDPTVLTVDSTTSLPGSGMTLNGAIGVPFTLQPGESRTVTFVIAWHFPNVQRFQHAGNLYGRRWPDALAVARYVAEHIGPLWERTRLYHQTVYRSNLPEEFLDAMTSQSCILRGPTCWWSEDGYFGGFEGSYGCCPLNCTHVWNYAQSHARLFPEVGRNMRVSNFITFLHPSGETSHREHGPHGAFIDGHCACIEGALREHQMSPDRGFLEQVWPGVKKAVDWMIETFDKDRDGVTTGQQWNTYDTAVSGANTFIGSQYLSALAAAEAMALAMGERETAARWAAVRRAGMKNQDERLWNGQYYIQLPDPTPARDYNNGCHADQLLGQWWAHMLGLGYLYPAERVRKSLQTVMKHNFREKFAGFKQVPRRYVLDDEGGLLICTWPRNDRPKSFIEYADEVWTGIEYSTAGAMIYEGLIDEARTIVRTARGRYDGRRRDTLNSGPGGNPFNELECGKFYARAMSSWSLLVACQGLVLDGPRGLLGFRPKWQPADHRSFFTAPEGWGLFVQQREGKRQTDRIEVRHGRLRIKELVFELPEDAAAATASVTAAGKPVKAALQREGTQVRLSLGHEASVPEGEAIEVVFAW